MRKRRGAGRTEYRLHEGDVFIERNNPIGYVKGVNRLNEKVTFMTTQQEHNTPQNFPRGNVTMDSDTFTWLIGDTLDAVRELVQSKNKEYAPDVDKLHNFRVAAELQGSTPVEALGGMLAKHTVSVYDMIPNAENFTMEQWDEKILDHITYLCILKTMIYEMQFTHPKQ